MDISKARWKTTDRNRFIATLIETGNPATAADAIGPACPAHCRTQRRATATATASAMRATRRPRLRVLTWW
jgi:hypothetical protein